MKSRIEIILERSVLSRAGAGEEHVHTESPMIAMK